jgi:mannose-6-phosphate isomerase-like protein (cupin superfamily)
MKPFVVDPGDGETVTDRPERTIRILCAHELLDLTWTRYEPGERGPDPHVHHRHVDAFYVLEGELVFGLGPDVERVRAPAGTFVAAPPDLVHTFGNESGDRACFLNMHGPSTGFADNLRSLGEFDSHEPPADGGRPRSDGVVLLAGEGEHVENHERARWIKAEFTELSVLELAVEPEWTVALHHHDDHFDSFYVLGGDAEILTEDGPVPAPSGTLAAAPPGVQHGIRNPGPGRTRLLNVHAPDAGFVSRSRAR